MQHTRILELIYYCEVIVTQRGDVGEYISMFERISLRVSCSWKQGHYGPSRIREILRPTAHWHTPEDLNLILLLCVFGRLTLYFR